jgi:hypothetical protein
MEDKAPLWRHAVVTPSRRCRNTSVAFEIRIDARSRGVISLMLPNLARTWGVVR